MACAERDSGQDVETELECFLIIVRFGKRQSLPGREVGLGKAALESLHIGSRNQPIGLVFAKAELLGLLLCLFEVGFGIFKISDHPVTPAEIAEGLGFDVSRTYAPGGFKRGAEAVDGFVIVLLMHGQQAQFAQGFELNSGQVVLPAKSRGPLEGGDRGRDVVAVGLENSPGLGDGPGQ